MRPNLKTLVLASLLCSLLAPARPTAATNVALQIERQAAGTVGAGSNTIFDSVVYSAGNISYNAATGVLTLNEAGRYVIQWWVAYQLVDADNPVAVLALSSSQGDFLEGNSPSPSGQVTGIGIIDAVVAPVTVSLVNASTGDLYYATSVPIKATLVVVQDDIAAPPP